MPMPSTPWCAGAGWPPGRTRWRWRPRDPGEADRLAAPPSGTARGVLMSWAPTPSSPPRRRFRPVEVTAVRRLAPRMVRVALRGDELADFEVTAPAQRVKLLFPAPGQAAPCLPEFGPDGLRFPDDQPRPVMRT